MIFKWVCYSKSVMVFFWHNNNSYLTTFIYIFLQHVSTCVGHYHVTSIPRSKGRQHIYCQISMFIVYWLLCVFLVQVHLWYVLIFLFSMLVRQALCYLFLCKDLFVQCVWSLFIQFCAVVSILHTFCNFGLVCAVVWDLLWDMFNGRKVWKIILGVSEGYDLFVNSILAFIW